GAAARSDGTALLDHPRRLLASAAARVERLVTSVATAERSAAEYRARRLTTSLCDLVQGALLLEEAAWELRTRSSARKAVVAGLFTPGFLPADPDAAAALGGTAVPPFSPPPRASGRLPQPGRGPPPVLANTADPP